ncbi:MAG: hypothetical protein ABIR30_07525 [Chitinophagaceae bacterium]
MKKIFLFLSLVLFSVCAVAQKNDHTVSFDGIGAIKIGMNKAALEKLLGIKIEFKHIGIDEVYMESIQAKYLGVDMELTLFRRDDVGAVLEDISTTNPLCKTAEGVGTGTDQLTIINKFGDPYLLIIGPVWEEEGAEYRRSKTKTTITVAEIENYRSAIIFSLVNKKVVSIKVGPTPEFRDRE